MVCDFSYSMFSIQFVVFHLQWEITRTLIIKLNGIWEVVIEKWDILDNLPVFEVEVKSFYECSLFYSPTVYSFPMLRFFQISKKFDSMFFILEKNVSPIVSLITVYWKGKKHLWENEHRWEKSIQNKKIQDCTAVGNACNTVKIGF